MCEEERRALLVRISSFAIPDDFSQATSNGVQSNLALVSRRTTISKKSTDRRCGPLQRHPERLSNSHLNRPLLCLVSSNTAFRETLLFACALRLRSKTRVLGSRPQKEIAIYSTPLVVKCSEFKKRIANVFLQFRGFPQGQCLTAGPLHSKNAAFCVCIMKPSVLIACAPRHQSPWVSLS